MYEYYFTFGSVTTAQTAVRALDRIQIPNRLLRTPKAIQLQGCGYSIAVRSGYYVQARDELDRRRLNYRRVYCRFSDGSFEEVPI